MTPVEFIETRKRLGFTQEVLAALLGVSDRQIRRYEKGTTPIPKLVAKLLNNEVILPAT